MLRLFAAVGAAVRRMLVGVGLVLLAGAGFCEAQKLLPVETLTTLPVGLTLPVAMRQTIKAGESRPGSEVVAYTTQRVPLGAGTYLPAGVPVHGTVVASQAADAKAGQLATIGVRFDSVSYRGRTIAVRTRVLAVANFTRVDDTFASTNDGGDKENPSPANWTTQQVGGDEVNRERWEGEVDDDTMQRVGFADFYGVYADPPRGATGTAAIPRAMGVFSTTAFGTAGRELFGFDDRDVLTSSDAEGTITAPGKLIVHRGDNLLLELDGDGVRAI